MTLDEILQQVADVEAVMAELSDQQVEIPESLVSQLEAFLTVEDDKISAVGRLTTRFQEVVDVCNAEAQALWARAAAYTQRRKRLLKFVAFVMAKNGIKKLEGTRYTFTKLDGKPRVVIDDEQAFVDAWRAGQLPQEVVTIPEPEPRISRETIARLLLSGKPVRGARMETGPASVRVYQ